MIPEKAIQAAHAAICEQSLDDCLDPDWRGKCVKAVEAAAPHMPAGGTGDREEVEERIKSIVQEVAMTVDYTERLYAAVQEIMAVTMPRPTP